MTSGDELPPGEPPLPLFEGPPPPLPPPPLPLGVVVVVVVVVEVAVLAVVDVVVLVELVELVDVEVVVVGGLLPFPPFGFPPLSPNATGTSAKPKTIRAASRAMRAAVLSVTGNLPGGG